MKAKVIFVQKKDTKEGKQYFKNAILVSTRFGDDLAVASSNKDYTDKIGTDDNVDVFWYKDHYCINE